MNKTFAPWRITLPVRRQQTRPSVQFDLDNADIEFWPLSKQILQSIGIADVGNKRPPGVGALAETAATLVAKGNELLESGRLEKAEALYRRAIALDPRYAPAHFKLGNLLSNRQQLDAAAACYRHAIGCDPAFVKAHYNLGNTLKGQGMLADAEQSYRTAQALDPSYTVVDINLGVLLLDAGRLEEAEACYRRVLEHDPGEVMALHNLSLVLKSRGLLAEAERYCRQAIELKPDYADAHNTLGTILNEQGLLSEAEDAYRKALALNPTLSVALNNLAGTLKKQGRDEEAEACCRQALRIAPNYASAYITLGNVLMEQGRFIETEAACRKALTLEPKRAETHNCLAGALISQGHTDEALAAFKKALELKPDYSAAHSNLLFTLNYLSSLSPAERLRAAKRFGQAVAGKGRSRFACWSSPPTPRRLRVGLVSGDLRQHVVGYFLESILSQIDPSRVELIAYPTKRASDETSARLKRLVGAWKPITDLSDAAAAQRIHDDGLHVLLDLSGHTSDNRLPVFAWKPAPVQATWLGYFATTGVAEIDYLLADRSGVPEENRDQFSESVYYLPDTRLCFTAPTTNCPTSELPAQRNGHVTFGCFQNLSKLNDDVLRLWARILAAKPAARLYIQSPPLAADDARLRLRERLRQHGIADQRVTLQGPLERDAYLAAHARVDIILDTFPYPGGTTTCEALWMGVPTLTLAGTTLLERQGASLLVAAGLGAWVANSKDDYLAKAISLTADLPALAKLRRSLRQQVLQSPLFDAPLFARNLENALWDMWATYERTRL